MAVNKILFKDLPFSPDPNQVFYIENGYNEAVNDFICNHYGELKSRFRRIGMEFVYLPYLLKENNIKAKVRYYAPYLSPKRLVQKVQSNAFVPYISDAGVKAVLKPSLLFEGREEGKFGEVSFLALDIENLINSNEDVIDRLEQLVLSAREEFYNEEIECCDVCGGLEEDMDCSMPEPCLSAAPVCDAFQVFERKEPSDKPDGKRGRLLKRLGKNINTFCDETVNEEVPEKAQEEIEEGRSLKATADILRDLRITVQRLRLEGVSLMAIHEFIDKQEPLSRMIITPDYRIFLPDYNNMEIEMGALPKAIYFLYLRYPEGIVYKHMPDYFSELLGIYRQLRPNTDEARLNLTITKVVNPLGNALNENLARIRKAFVEKFDEHLANNYIILGERGAAYSISLDRDLISWEE